MNRPKAIDLFAGAGGFSLGIEQAGFDVVLAVEYDPVHATTHLYNFPHVPIKCEDVTNLDTSIIDGEIDLIFGGPPCQGFSQGGNRDSNDSRNNLVFQFLRVIGEVQPKYFIMENVPGLLSMSGYADAIVTKAKQLGYRVEYRSLNCLNYGIPQDRERVFFMGWRKDQPRPMFPEVRSMPERSILHNITPTVADVFHDLPEIEDPKYRLNPHYKKDPFTWCEWDIRSKENLDHFGYRRKYLNILHGCGFTIHSPEVVDRFSKTLPGEREPISRFHRLKLDGFAPTLRAGTAQDRGSFTAPRPIHPVLNRCITIREGARLHGYPDWFSFHETISHGFRQIGNSVPPPLAKYLGLEIMKVLGKVPTQPAEVLDIALKSWLLKQTMTEACEYLGVNYPAPIAIAS